jgi:hypothetical protein
MHAPEKWGYLQFSRHHGEEATADGGKDTVAFVEPPDAAAREMLWMIYEKQQKYRQQHGHYAEILRQLELVGGDGIKLQATDQQFMAAVNGSDGTLSIDQDGEIRRRP